MPMRLEELIFIQQYRLLQKENKKKVIQRANNLLLVTRFRRFIIRHKSNDSPNITTPKCF
jgi:hypothetical protein